MYHLILNGKGYFHINLYKGETSDKNVRDGFGVQLFPNGCVYTGFWKNNAAHGTGKLLLPDGTIYEGEYKDNNIQSGIVSFFNGARFEGIFCGDKNERFTSGTFTFSSGDRFQGKWEEGLIIQGRLYDKNLKALEFFTDDAIVRQYGNKGVIVPRKEKWLYEGGIQGNHQSGHGILFSTFPQYFVTKFTEDRINGFTKRMRITWGEISEGELIDNKKIGTWKRMITRGYEIVGDVQETRGRVTFPFLNDDYFEGEMDINWKADDKPYKFSFKKGHYFLKTSEGDYKSISISSEIDSIYRIKEVMDRGLNFENTFNRIKNSRPQIVREISEFTHRLIDNEKLFPESIHPLLVQILGMNFNELSHNSIHQGRFLGQVIPKSDYTNAFGKSFTHGVQPSPIRKKTLTPDMSFVDDNKSTWKTGTLRDQKKTNMTGSISPTPPQKKDSLRVTLKGNQMKTLDDPILKTSKITTKETNLDVSYVNQDETHDIGRNRTVSPHNNEQVLKQTINPLEKTNVTAKAFEIPIDKPSNMQTSKNEDPKRMTLKAAMIMDFGNVMTVHNIETINNKKTVNSQDESMAQKANNEKRTSGQFSTTNNNNLAPRKTSDLDDKSKTAERKSVPTNVPVSKQNRGSFVKEIKKTKTDVGRQLTPDSATFEHSGEEENSMDIGDNTTFVQKRRQTGFYNLLLDDDIEFFEGTIIKRQKQGFCRLIYDYGLVKEGMFVDDKMEGDGMIVYNSSLMLHGTFKNDLIDGPAIIRLENEIIEANFRNGEFRNKRIQVRSNGVVIIPEGNFENPEILKGSMTVYFKNNHRLLCEFEANDIMKNQKCKLFDPFGNLWIGKIVIPKDEQYKHFITLSSVKVKFRIALDTDGVILKLGTY
jgi:hypothetical protein